LLHGGCDLAQQAIALRPDLRVLYTTGSAIDDKVKAIIAEGAHFLPKPYTQDQLQDSIKELIAA
jgi:DNA-binding NtrC family response regulator